MGHRQGYLQGHLTIVTAMDDVTSGVTGAPGDGYRCGYLKVAAVATTSEQPSR
jgi:hypothetical protein